MFRLRVLTPSDIVIDDDIDFLRAEDNTGSFGILSRHTDFITILNPSIVIFKRNNKENYIAVNGGVLSFRNNLATIVARAAVLGNDLDKLQDIIRERFIKKSDKERELYEAIKNMEQEFMKKLIEMEKEYG